MEYSTIFNSHQQAILFSAQQDVIYAQERSVIFEMLKPKLTKDGDQWCCILGSLPEDDCIVGFGESPNVAIDRFYRNYMGFPISF